LGVLLKEQQLLISNPEIPQFLVLCATPTETQPKLAVAILAERGGATDPSFRALWEVADPSQTPHVVAAFLSLYPKSVFSLESGYPLYLLAGPNWRKMYSLEALIEGVELGFREFGTAVYKPPQPK